MAKIDEKTLEKPSKLRYPARLQKAILSCDKMMKPMREARHTILDRYASGYYTGESNPARPINMLMRGVQIIVPYLVADNPRAMITADKPEYSPFANTLSKLANKRMRNILLYKVLRRAVYNAMWSIGITKTGLSSTDDIEYNGERYPKMDVYCDTVDFEDFVYDISARCIEEAEFIGNGYMISMEELKDSGKFKNYDKVRSVNKLWGDTTPENISKNIEDSKFRELHDYAYVYDIWLPEKQIICTLAKDGEGDKYLRTVDWDGPDTGPYDILGFNYFPNSIIPIPPMFTWLDQDEQLNKMARKMFRQSSRDKTVLAYDGTAQDDAARITNSADGESVRVESIDRLKEIHFGGVNQDIWPVIQWLRNQISEQAGNLDTLGGMGGNAKTLGQEQMMQSSSSKVLDDWSWQIHHFATSIMKKIARYDWTDPMLQEVVNKQIGNISIPVEVNSSNLQGEFFDYNFDVMPYSMQKINPETKYQKTLQWISQVILPTLQMAASQGAVLNAPELARRTAEYLDIDITNLYSIQQPQQMQPDAYQPMGGQSVRTSVSGQADNRAGGNSANAQANLNTQQAEAY